VSLGVIAVLVFLLIAVCVAAYVLGGTRVEAKQAELHQEAQEQALEDAIVEHRETLDKVSEGGLADRLRGHAAKLNLRSRERDK
jgi:regulatory protein YycI of two-component signal transduction system YycFG